MPLKPTPKIDSIRVSDTTTSSLDVSYLKELSIQKEASLKKILGSNNKKLFDALTEPEYRPETFVQALGIGKENLDKGYNTLSKRVDAIKEIFKYGKNYRDLLLRKSNQLAQ